MTNARIAAQFIAARDTYYAVSTLSDAEIEAVEDLGLPEDETRRRIGEISSKYRTQALHDEMARARDLMLRALEKFLISHGCGSWFEDLRTIPDRCAEIMARGE